MIMSVTMRGYGMHDQIQYETIQPLFTADWQQDPPALPELYKATNPSTIHVAHTPQLCVLSSGNAYRLINLVAAGYCMVNIYRSYQKMAIRHTYGIFAPLELPAKYFNFLLSSLHIVCKAMVGKTVAQWIVWCSEGNIMDLISYGLQNTTHSVD